MVNWSSGSSVPGDDWRPDPLGKTGSPDVHDPELTLSPFPLGAPFMFTPVGSRPKKRSTLLPFGLKYRRLADGHVVLRSDHIAYDTKSQTTVYYLDLPPETWWAGGNTCTDPVGTEQLTAWNSDGCNDYADDVYEDCQDVD